MAVAGVAAAAWLRRRGDSGVAAAAWRRRGGSGVAAAGRGRMDHLGSKSFHLNGLGRSIRHSEPLVTEAMLRRDSVGSRIKRSSPPLTPAEEADGLDGPHSVLQQASSISDGSRNSRASNSETTDESQFEAVLVALLDNSLQGGIG